MPVKRLLARRAIPPHNRGRVHIAIVLSAMLRLDQEKAMDFMTGVYLAAGLAVAL